MTGTLFVQQAELAHYLERLYRAAGMSRSDGRTMATAHIEADLRGISSHGSRLAPTYLAKLRSGRLNPKPRPTVLADSGGCLAWDGDLAPGPLAASHAVHTAVLRARRYGLAVVTVRGVGHAGALGVPAAHAAQQGLIAVVGAQTSSPSVALHGGTGQPVLGNSALALAVPGPDPHRPVVLDMATAALSWGTVHQLARTGRPLPPGCALDRHGRPTRSPAEAAALLPPGDGRGQALAIIAELLVGALTRSSPLPIGADGRGLVCLVLDPSRLGVADHLVDGVAGVSRAVRGPAPVPGGARMPGDRAWTHRDRATADGIAMPADDLRELITIGRPTIPAPAAWTAHLA